jgi:cytochrome c oxidase subunit II
MRKEPHIHRLRRAAIGATVAGTLLLAGCGALRDDSGRPLTTLNPKGKQAQSIDDLVSPVFWVAGVVFVLVQVGVIYMVIRFRRREDDVDGVDEPVQTHGIPALEWAWTGLPLVVLVALGVLNAKTILDLEKTPDDAIDVEVYGQQWWWEYRYDVDGDDQPDIITANQMVVPAGRHIHLKIRSNDVIHSFWIPQLNGKMDSVPGRTNDWSIEADKPGLYQGTCTEFCGLSHALMRMEVKAVTADEFEAWKDEQLKPAVTTVDHKKIGIMYGVGSFFFFLIGGGEALLIRLQLARPDGKLLSADLYNQVFTMHGVTMIFLVHHAVGAAFMNYCIPLQIGARDVAFPRINALVLVLPVRRHLREQLVVPRRRRRWWLVQLRTQLQRGLLAQPRHRLLCGRLQIVGIASLIGSINLIVTVFNMRAPGMTWWRCRPPPGCPSSPSSCCCSQCRSSRWRLFLLTFDRRSAPPSSTHPRAATRCCGSTCSGSSAPRGVHHRDAGFGIVSEIIPVFSRKPLFGYRFVVFSGIAIGFMGFGVWAHHMFASGMGPMSVTAFSLATMFIAVPTGVKILNWMATMWGGRIRITVAMMYSIGLLRCSPSVDCRA